MQEFRGQTGKVIPTRNLGNTGSSTENIPDSEKGLGARRSGSGELEGFKEPGDKEIKREVDREPFRKRHEFKIKFSGLCDSVIEYKKYNKTGGWCFTVY